MPKIPKTLVLEREKKVWAMRMRGATYERIAQEVGITFSGVSNILARMHKRYVAKNMDDVEKCRQEQIAELSNVADEAYKAWESSRGQKIVIKKRARTKDGKFLPGDATEEKYTSDGDPRYLQVYMKAKADLREIIGANAPSKYEHTGKDGEAIKFRQEAEEKAESKVKNFMAKLFAKGQNEANQLEEDDE